MELEDPISQILKANLCNIGHISTNLLRHSLLIFKNKHKQTLSLALKKASRREHSKQIEAPRHPLYRHCPTRHRLQSRKSFMNSVLPLTESPEVTRLALYGTNNYRKRDIIQLSRYQGRNSYHRAAQMIG